MKGMSMNASEWLSSLFTAIDGKDARGFVSHLSEGVRFEFGNLPAIEGAEAVMGFVVGFFASIRGLRHRIIEHWLGADDTILCRGVVTYERHDGSQLTIPFANIMKLEGNCATEYRIYADASELYQ